MRITIITILISILFTQCKKPEDVYHRISQEHLEWVNYKEGSYWVFREENSGVFDTFKVKSYVLKNVKTDINNHFEENLYINIVSANNIDSIYVNSSGSGIVLTSDQKSEYLSYLLRIPIIENDYLRLGEDLSQRVIFDSVMSEYKLDTFNFKNVVRAYDIKNAVYNYNPTKIYTCKGIGIVRKEFLNTGEIWNLIEYNIET